MNIFKLIKQMFRQSKSLEKVTSEREPVLELPDIDINIAAIAKNFDKYLSYIQRGVLGEPYTELLKAYKVDSSLKEYGKEFCLQRSKQLYKYNEKYKNIIDPFYLDYFMYLAHAYKNYADWCIDVPEVCRIGADAKYKYNPTSI